MDAEQREQVIAIADEAARAIMVVVTKRAQSQDVQIDKKQDGSYVTEADMASNAVICRELQRVSNFPIVSEEGVSTYPASGGRKKEVDESHYWLVDPLDGTKEFVNGSTEFTVNIALVETATGVPVFGVVVVPVTGEAFWGGPKMGYSLRRGGWNADAPTQIHASTLPSKERLRIATSRSHGGDAATLENCVRSVTGRTGQSAEDWDHCTAGSSLKLLWVANGRVHMYPRLGPTCWWDTAAAHAVVLGAGADVFAFDPSSPCLETRLLYPEGFRKTERLLNPWFIVLQPPQT